MSYKNSQGISYITTDMNKEASPATTCDSELAIQVQPLHVSGGVLSFPGVPAVTTARQGQEPRLHGNGKGKNEWIK